MNFKEYQEYSKRTLNMAPSKDARQCTWLLGRTGESGETADYMKKVLFHGKEFDKDNLIKELGDVLYYLAAVATENDIDLGEVAKLNVDKLMKRYPNGFSVADSEKRVDVIKS